MTECAQVFFPFCLFLHFAGGMGERPCDTQKGCELTGTLQSNGLALGQWVRLHSKLHFQLLHQHFYFLPPQLASDSHMKQQHLQKTP